MKTKLTLFAMTLAVLCFPGKDIQSQSLFAWGNVRWSTGSPAIGVEVKLMLHNGEMKSHMYTDQTGSYAFFGIDGQPSDHYVMVLSGGSLLKTQMLYGVFRSGRIPMITLSAKLLKTYAFASPDPIATGQATLITVAITDEMGQPVPGVTTTISAGGGKFLRTREIFNPRSRLHGPYVATGTTDNQGIYKTSWVCNPCARGYGLRVESRKNGYINSALDITVNIRN